MPDRRSSLATSTTILLDEIRAHLRGEQARLPAPVPYRNVVAQVRLPERQAAHEAFFRERLADVDEPTLAFGLQEHRAQPADTEAAEQALGEPLNQRLRALARALGVSAASLFHLAWAQVLSRVAGREDVVFGSVLLGRLSARSGAVCRCHQA